MTGRAEQFAYPSKTSYVHIYNKETTEGTVKTRILEEFTGMQPSILEYDYISFSAAFWCSGARVASRMWIWFLCAYARAFRNGTAWLNLMEAGDLSLAVGLTPYKKCAKYGTYYSIIFTRTLSE